MKILEYTLKNMLLIAPKAMLRKKRIKETKLRIKF